MLSRIELGDGVRKHCAAHLSEVELPSKRGRSKIVCELARSLGFIRAGIANLAPFEQQEQQLRAFVANGYAGEMHYLAEQTEDSWLRATPQSLMPEACSVICVALPYQRPTPIKLRRSATSSKGDLVAAYAHGQDYHLVMKELLLELADHIAERFGLDLIARACVDTAPVLERDLAERAGFAFIGKNTLAITPGIGSTYLLGELFVNLPLEEVQEKVEPGCGQCTSCLQACPTQAFVGPYVLDARKCISYLTIESRADIPRNLRALIGTRVFGCDICQAVCPFNHGSSVPEAHAALKPREEVSTLELIKLAEIGSSAFRRLVAHSSMRRVNRNQMCRNACVALGNTGQAEAVAPLQRLCLSERNQQIKEHAMWALFQLAREHQLQEAALAIDDLAKKAPQLYAEEAQYWEAS